MRPSAMPEHDIPQGAHLRTALWIRTRASAGTVQNLLGTIPAGIVAQAEGEFVHVLYDERRASGTHLHLVAQIRESLTRAGVVYEPAIGTHVLPSRGG